MIYEYQCPQGHVTEHVSKYEQRTTSLQCIHCGLEAKYKISAPHIDYYHMGVDPNFGTASDKWADMHTQKLAVERKQELYEE